MLSNFIIFYEEYLSLIKIFFMVLKFLLIKYELN